MIGSCNLSHPQLKWITWNNFSVAALAPNSGLLVGDLEEAAFVDLNSASTGISYSSCFVVMHTPCNKAVRNFHLLSLNPFPPTDQVQRAVAEPFRGRLTCTLLREVSLSADTSRLLILWPRLIVLRAASVTFDTPQCPTLILIGSTNPTARELIVKVLQYMPPTEREKGLGLAWICDLSTFSVTPPIDLFI